MVVNDEWMMNNSWILMMIIMNPKSSMNDESWIFMNNQFNFMHRSCLPSWSLRIPLASVQSNPRFTGVKHRTTIWTYMANRPYILVYMNSLVTYQNWYLCHLFLTVKYELLHMSFFACWMLFDRFPLAKQVFQRDLTINSHCTIGRRSLPESPRLFQGIPILNLSATHTHGSQI